MGRSSEAKNPVHPKKVKCDGQTDRRTDGPTDGPTKRGVESRSTRLKILLKSEDLECKVFASSNLGYMEGTCMDLRLNVTFIHFWTQFSDLESLFSKICNAIGQIYAKLTLA